MAEAKCLLVYEGDTTVIRIGARGVASVPTAGHGINLYFRLAESSEDHEFDTVSATSWRIPIELGGPPPGRPLLRAEGDGENTGWGAAWERYVDARIPSFKAALFVTRFEPGLKKAVPLDLEDIDCIAPQDAQVVPAADLTQSLARLLPPKGESKTTNVEATPAPTVLAAPTPTATPTRTPTVTPTPTPSSRVIPISPPAPPGPASTPTVIARPTSMPTAMPTSTSPPTPTPVGATGLPTAPSSGNLQFIATTTAPQAEAGRPYQPNGQPFSFCDPPTTGPTTQCPPPGTTARNPSGGSPPYHFQLGTAGGFPPIGLSLGKDGQLTGTPDLATGGKTYRFTVCAVDLKADSVCREVSIAVAGGATPAPIPAPKPTASPTLTPTTQPRVRSSAKITSITCVANSTGGIVTTVSYTASGTATGNPGDAITFDDRRSTIGPWTIDMEWTGIGDSGSYQASRVRNAGDPATTNWTVQGQDVKNRPETGTSFAASLYVYIGGSLADYKTGVKCPIQRY
ncbi:MAG: hypothetical protein HY682_05845 [Chloroflexi bacterium]|nr:hypothetical protein [Chloroflexota bacterium]